MLAIAAGVVDTDIWSGVPQAAIEAMLQIIPAGRKGTPDDIAEAVAWVLRDAAVESGILVDSIADEHRLLIVEGADEAQPSRVALLGAEIDGVVIRRGRGERRNDGPIDVGEGTVGLLVESLQRARKRDLVLVDEQG